MKSLSWTENGQTITKRWITEADHSAPKFILLGDDRLRADEYLDKVSQGAAYIWRGDFHNARQLLQAVGRRLDRSLKLPSDLPERDLFNRHRQRQSQRAQILGRLFICIEDDLSIALPRAPDFQGALRQVIEGHGGGVISLKDLLGLKGAYEWRRKGVPIAVLGNNVYPHYGVFSPNRGEYLELIERAPLPPQARLAFDIGTGTGVIAALLAKRGLAKIIATECDPRALKCAQENLQLLGYDKQVELLEADLFPSGAADLIVCNPPWLPARPTTPIERSIYDENSAMLRRFLSGCASHLNRNGEVWLILSDLAEHLHLRPPGLVEQWIAEGGLAVIDVLKIKPSHSKSQDPDDPLHRARSREVTALWRLHLKAEAT